jgi:hypothetical protein
MPAEERAWGRGLAHRPGSGGGHLNTMTQFRHGVTSLDTSGPPSRIDHHDGHAGLDFDHLVGDAAKPPLTCA